MLDEAEIFELCQKLDKKIMKIHDQLLRVNAEAALDKIVAYYARLAAGIGDYFARELDASRDMFAVFRRRLLQVEVKLDELIVERSISA